MPKRDAAAAQRRWECAQYEAYPLTFMQTRASVPRTAIVVIGAALVFALTNVLLGVFSALRPAGPDVSEQHWRLLLMLASAGVAFMITLIGLIYTFVARKRNGGRRLAPYRHRTSTQRKHIRRQLYGRLPVPAHEAPLRPAS